jgi:D-serine deaminase-like pyridoxal phosphate-dependent protein
MDALGLDTPAPYVDLDILERNLRRMQDLARSMNVGLRPHTKTHKIPEIARMQLAGGAIGITVAKVGEAEVMPGDDVLIAYPVLPDKLPRLRELARTRRVTVTVDSVEAARGLEDTPALVDVDVGFHRCGVQSPADFEAVARACGAFRGLFYYPAGLDEAAFRKAAAIVADCTSRRTCEVVSGGSTPNAPRTPLIPQTTEIRPGTYVFYDATRIALGLAGPEDCALRVLVTVVSTAVPGQCVVDGGSKTFSLNPIRGGTGYGVFPDRPGWLLEKMNEEHGYVRTPSPARVGEKVWAIPSHAGTCTNMHDEVWYGRGGRVEGKWPVAARGRVR